MKRDMDLIRSILIRLEEKPLPAGACLMIPWNDDELKFDGHDFDCVFYNIRLIEKEGFIAQPNRSSAMGGFVFMGLTWRGHEFLEDIRNPEVWTKTKQAMNKVGGVGLDLAIQIAKGYAKELAQRMGIPLA